MIRWLSRGLYDWWFSISIWIPEEFVTWLYRLVMGSTDRDREK